MSYPRLEIHLDAIRENARRLLSACRAHGIEPVGITKVCCGEPAVARALLECGYTALGDSRLENLARYADLPCEKMLIRLPSPSDAYRLLAEVIECNVKPTLPWGDVGTDAFGHFHTFEDRGDVRRSILSVGRADIEPECLEPMEPGIAVLDASSDHLLLDLGGCERELRPGDVIEFKVGYAGVLRACTSPCVEKACV